MSLYASVQDLELEGMPSAASATVASSRLRMLQSASNQADTYLRARYALPLLAEIGIIEQVPATSSTGTGTISAVITPGSSITQAYGVRLEVLTTGASGVATARISTDGGTTWGATFTVTLGALAVSIGITLTFADAGGAGWFDGDLYYIPVSYAALTSHVVAIASWSILRRRGLDPDSASYDAIRTAYKDAMKWLEHLRDNKVDPGLTDSTSGVDEGGFFYDPPTDGDGDRDWTSVMGRVARDQPSTISEEDCW